MAHFIYPNPKPQMDDSEVINFLLQTEIIPLCLRIMETGNELSKTVRRYIDTRPCRHSCTMAHQIAPTHETPSDDDNDA